MKGDSEFFVLGMARPAIKSLNPCIHGGEFVETTEKLGLDNLLDFSTNINPLGAPHKIYEEIGRKSFRIARYPETNSIGLRKAIAKHFDSHLSYHNVIVGNGSTELIHLFAYVFLKQNDICVIPRPTFGEYETASLKAGAKIVFIRLTRDFYLDPKRILSVKNVKVVFICNPNNPTGSIFCRKDLLKMVEKCYHKRTLVFIDECDMEFVEESTNYSMSKFVRKYPNLFVLKSFTKTYGLAGLRVGYGFACVPIINLLLKVKIPWNVNSIAQAAAIAALKDDSYLEKTRQLVNRQKPLLQERIRSFKGLKVYVSATNYFLVNVRGAGLTSKKLKESMLRYNVLVRDCASFRGMGRHFIRVAVKSQGENDKFIEALSNALSVYSYERRQWEAIKEGKLSGSDISCKYYPCHFEEQECTFCFCPFYPCEDNSTGGKLNRTRSGHTVWDCSGCRWIHQRTIAERVIDEISNLNKKPSTNKLRAIKEKLRGISWLKLEL